MNRAELRRAVKEQEKSKAIYNLTNEDIDKIKREASDKALEVAFTLMLGLPVMVLHNDWGFGKKRITRFIDQVTELNDAFQQGYIGLDDIHKILKDEADVDIVIKA